MAKSFVSAVKSFSKDVKKRSNHSAFATAPDGKLFPATNPAIDGEECLHDCASCTVKLPAKFSIEEHDKLYGYVKGWERHLIVATGKTDWVKEVSDEKGSVMEAVELHKDLVEGGRLMLSASNMPLPEHSTDEPAPQAADTTTVLLLPSFTLIHNVHPSNVPTLLQSHVNPAPTNTTPLPAPSTVTNQASPLHDQSNTQVSPLPLPTAPCPHKYLVLLCSQKTRDARCGQTAPLLRKELERHLRPLGLQRDLNDTRPGGCGIYFISHVGGHKYSANVMVYRRAEGPGGEANQCIWVARVRPEDCENLVRFTVLQGKVVKPGRQLRGGFDREKSLVSW